MNFRAKRLAFAIPIAFCIVIAGILIYRYYSAPWSIIAVDLDRLAGIKRHVPKPIAWSERAVTYEGEDIWVGATIPRTGGNLDSLEKHIVKSKVPIRMRIFEGRTEIRDSLFKPPPTDLPLTYAGFLYGSAKPGDSIRWRITQYTSLKAGDYWGMADAGKFSKKFKIRVDPVPAPSAFHKNLYDELIRVSNESGRHWIRKPLPGTFWMELRNLATVLLALSQGAPLRMEGLRFCARSIPHPKDGHFADADSTLFAKVVEQWAREPRMEPADVVWSLSRLCSDPLDDTCMPQLAQEWGGDRMLRYTKLWQESQRKRLDRHSRKK